MNSSVPLMALTFIASSGLLSFQSTSGRSSAVPAALSKSLDMGTTELRMFADTRKVKFKLATSWIPGEKHQGLFRYKLDAWVNKPTGRLKESTQGDEDIDELDDSESVGKLLERVSTCTMTLVLYDQDEFIFRSHVIPFIRGIDPEHARLQSLFANDAFQMDSQEYRQFIVSGKWAILWSGC